MNKIHDPNLDGLFRNGAPQGPTSLTVATPMSADQLLAMIASEQMAAYNAATFEHPLHGLKPHEAVDKACEILAEAIHAVNSGKLQQMVIDAKSRHAGDAATALPTH